jgi:hypothetical protein
VSRLRALSAALLAAAVASPALAGAELVLVDGTVISGTSVERKEDQYLLTGDRGVVTTVPAALVKQMRLTGGDAPPPTGLTFSVPQVLVGEKIEGPGRREMLAAFGRPPALFQPPSRNQSWVPTDAYAGKDVTEFSPATWAPPVFDPIWRPTSDYTAESDVTQFRPVKWRPTVVNTDWRPRDGFGETEWFPSVATPRRAEPPSK